MVAQRPLYFCNFVMEQDNCGAAKLVHLSGLWSEFRPFAKLVPIFFFYFVTKSLILIFEAIIYKNKSE